MAQNEVEELEEALAGFFSGLAELQIEAGQISNAAAGVSALRIASSTAGGFLEPPTYDCEFIARGRSVAECLELCDRFRLLLPRFGGSVGAFRLVSAISGDSVSVVQPPPILALFPKSPPARGRGLKRHLATMPFTVVVKGKS